MKNIKELYSALASFPTGNAGIKLTYSQMEIEWCFDEMIVTKEPYLTGRMRSTRYFDEDILEKEYEIEDGLKLFYSSSKERCIKWLNKERDAAVEGCRRYLQRLEKAEIKEELESWRDM